MSRPTRKIPIRDEFLIVTNGKRSEKNYFEVLRSKIKSIYKIKVQFINGDPTEVVSVAVKAKTESNRVWCVFDKDEFSDNSIYHAMAIARKNHVGVAFSNVAFEVWLVEHFCCFDSEKSATELIACLNELMKKAGYNCNYSKTDIQQVEEIFIPRLSEAVENADRAYQKRMAHFKQSSSFDSEAAPVCSWNSYTDVHKLIRALKVDRKSN